LNPHKGKDTKLKKGENQKQKKRCIEAEREDRRESCIYKDTESGNFSKGGGNSNPREGDEHPEMSHHHE